MCWFELVRQMSYTEPRSSQSFTGSTDGSFSKKGDGNVRFGRIRNSTDSGNIKEMECNQCLVCSVLLMEIGTPISFSAGFRYESDAESIRWIFVSSRGLNGGLSDDITLWIISRKSWVCLVKCLQPHSVSYVWWVQTVTYWEGDTESTRRKPRIKFLEAGAV